MLGVERLGGAVVWCFFVAITWIQAQFIHPLAEWWLESVLGTWEESLKSVIRELFAQVIRIVNYVLNALFSWFPGYQSVKTTFQKPSAWQSWWDENRQSTFNAIIDRDKSMRGGAEGLNLHTTEAPKPSKSQGGYAETQPPLSAPRRGLRYLFGWGSSRVAAVDMDSSSSKKRKKGNQPKNASSKKGKRIPAHKKMKRNGSELFDRPAGWAVQEKAKRGFLEDWRIGAELATTAVFDALRWLIRKALFMPEREAFSPLGVNGTGPGWALGSQGDDMSPERPDRSHHTGADMRRTNSFSDWESLHSVWTAAEVIKAAGYPLEQHTVTTSDGYILRMERLPRHGGRDVVFFMHGILDTSMGWVSNGVTGSQAFAAFDQGFDVWLGNSRANPPRVHENKEMMGAAYWHFTVNELGQKDIAAQIDHIHVVKCKELSEPLGHSFTRRPNYRVRRHYSEPALSSLESNGGVNHQSEELSDQARLVTQQASAAEKVAQLQPSAATTKVAAPQGHANAQPRERVGLLSLMKRNKSDIAGGSTATGISRRWHGPAHQEAQPQIIAEDEEQQEEGDQDLFASPRSQPEGSNPECAAAPAQSVSSKHAASQSDQQAVDQQPVQHQQPIPLHPPASPIAIKSSGSNPRSSSAALAGSPPITISSSSLQPTLSTSAPSHYTTPIHHWPAHSSRAESDQPQGAHQHPAVPDFVGQAATQPGDGDAAGGVKTGKSEDPSPSAMRDGSGRLRGRSSSRHSLHWSDSHESLVWSSHEDLAQLAPDRASADGVEQPPGEGFTIESASRHNSTGFAAPPAAQSGTPHHQERDKQQQNDGDLVAAEQEKVKGEPGSRTGSHRGSHSGSHKGSGKTDEEPYRLRAVGHSLGGASLLIYAVTRCMKGQPTHLARLILLTPAGFQQNYPKAAAPFLWILPPLVWALHWLRPGVGAACYIPSSLLRYVTFKLTVDMQHIPALNELVRAGTRVLLNGDSSQWDRAMQMPHYNTRSMPSISFHTGMHLIQWIRTGHFRLYNYRSKEANKTEYGTETPTDIAENYGFLRMPVDIMAGKSDGVIAKENVLMHYQKLQEANCSVTYKEFDFGHLDFTFAVKDDLRHYVLSRLLMDS